MAVDDFPAHGFEKGSVLALKDMQLLGAGFWVLGSGFRV